MENIEVTLSVVATPAPGLERKRKQQVERIIVQANKNVVVTIDTTKVPLESKLYDTVVSWFPANVPLIFVNVKINDEVIDVNAPPVMKPNSKLVYFVLVK